MNNKSILYPFGKSIISIDKNLLWIPLLYVMCFQASAQVGPPDLQIMETLRDDYGWDVAFGWGSGNPCPAAAAEWPGVICNNGRVSEIQVSCGANKLTTDFPAELNQLTELITLQIRGCWTDPNNPATAKDLTNLSKLNILRLDDNPGLTGTLQDLLGNSIMTSFPNFGVIEITNSGIGGIIPPDMPTNVIRFINQTRVGGTLPNNVPNVFRYVGNQLEGALPPNWVNSTVGGIRLHYNKFDVVNTPPGPVDNSQSGWRNTQTVPPTNVQVTPGGPNEATLSWTPIGYTWDGGYYEVLASPTPGGPYTSYGTTESAGGKTAAGLSVTGLPGGANYFVVRTFTPAHAADSLEAYQAYNDPSSLSFQPNLEPISPLQDTLDFYKSFRDNPNDLTSVNSAEVSAFICPGSILYVNDDAGGNDDGTSWAHAFNDLQDALALAASCPNVTEIWVAEGTYFPDQGVGYTPGNRSHSFVMQNNLAIYGGFPDTGNPTFADRDWAAYETILSGDIGNAGAMDNSYHLIFNNNNNLDATAILDGFTISGGNAEFNPSDPSFESENEYGGGMYNAYSSPTIVHCTFSGNYGVFGGGMYNTHSSPALTNCSFSGNSSADGGGMLNENGSSPTLVNCALINNTSGGGAGGMANNSSSSPVLSACLFTSNSGGAGGGMFNMDNAPSLTNCSFFGNSASFRGGAMYNDNSSPTVSSCSFSGNSAINDGGGMFNTNSSSPAVTNCILWGNGSELINDSSNPTVSHSIVQGGYPAGSDILNQDPLFVDAAGGDLRLLPCSPAIDAGTNTGAPTEDILGNLRPVDGNGDATATTDMGAYEFQSTMGYDNHIYVDVDATAGNDNGTSWTDAFRNLQDALEVAVRCEVDTIWVAEGTYYPDEGGGNTDNNRDASFILPDGVAVYGGFAGTEDPTTFDLATRDFSANETILSGDIDQDGTFSGNAYHVVLAAFATTTPTIRLDGFTVTGGNADGFGSITVNGQTISRDLGGGIAVYGGSNTLTNNTVTGNEADEGGGISTVQGTNTLTNNTVAGNEADFDGGGIYTRFGTNNLINNTVSGNEADFGGGIYTVQSTNTLTNNTVSGNEAEFGGGIYTVQGTNTLTNNTVAGNSTSDGGGGIYTFQGTNILTNNTVSGNDSGNGGGILTVEGANTLTNNTVAGNSAGNDGGGIFTFDGANTQLTNNIIWGNNSGIFNFSSFPTVTDNIIQGGFSGGTNNLDIDPLFVAPLPPGLNTGGDYRLLPCSPAIDAGTNTGAPTEDILGNLRPVDGNGDATATTDMGAYEYQGTMGYDNHIYVDVDATAGDNNGTSWGNAFLDLQDALEVAVRCEVDTIWVAEGTYRPSAHPAGCSGCSGPRDNTFLLPDGVAVYGGFAGTEDPTTFDLANRDFSAHETILSGDIGTPNDDSDNVHHVVLAVFNSTTPTIRLDGFTVTGGNANVSDFSSITVNGQLISRTLGGGIVTAGGTNTLTNNTVAGNQANFNGGGIFTAGGNNTLTNNTVTGNQANFNGGGIFTNLGDNTLTNNTVAGNTASNFGGGVFTNEGTNTLTNNIIWGNDSGLFDVFSSLTVNHNIIQGGFSGNNNSDIDPLFVSPLPPGLNTGGDYRLLPCSPAINAGNNAAYNTATGVDPGSDTDLDGNARLVGDDIDLGAYEFQGAQPLITCYLDGDDDTFGDPTQSQVFCQSCGAGYVTNNTDCDDNDPNITQCGGPADVSIADPCTCLNNATRPGNGQFSETVQVTSPTGDTWTVKSVTGLFLSSSPPPPAAPIPVSIGDPVPETAPGSGVYELQGIHTDGQGYTITLTNGSQDLSISNICYYPLLTINGLQDRYCANHGPVDISVTAQLGDSPAPATVQTAGFTLLDAQGNPVGTPQSGPATTYTFNPADLPSGAYLLRVEVDTGDDGASHPGCVQPIEQPFEVLQVGCGVFPWDGD